MKLRMEDLAPEAWQFIVGGSGDHPTKELWKMVPWLYRGTIIRANAVAKIPFAILRGQEEIDTSNGYENKVKFLKDPKRLLRLTEMALTLFGYSYFFRERNLLRTLGLRYVLPTAIKPKLNEDGLVGFERAMGGRKEVLEPEDLVYFWGADPFVELGHPENSPATAALAAAGVLMNVDEFATKYFKSGAIKATILGVPTGTPQSAREELKTLWQKMISGAGNMWNLLVTNADTVKPTIIGEGLNGLTDNELTKEKREDIATALGIPHTILFSNAANFATAEQDDFHLYDKTIVPEAEFIEEVLNEQVFMKEGLTFQFRPNEMDVYQEDEESRSGSLLNLKNAGMPLDLAIDVLGFDLTDEQRQRLEEAMQEKEERREEMQDRFANARQEPPRPVAGNQVGAQPDTMRTHLEKWQKKAIRQVSGGKSAAAAFDSDLIPASLHGAISGALDEAKSAADVEQVFRQSMLWVGYP